MEWNRILCVLPAVKKVTTQKNYDSVWTKQVPFPFYNRFDFDHFLDCWDRFDLNRSNIILNNQTS